MTEDKRRYSLRRLTHAEVELWTKVTATVSPFRARPAPPVEPPPPPATKAVVAEPLNDRRPAPVPHRDRPAPPKPPTPLVEIDHRTRVKIKRGRLEVSAKLDLHGMRQDEAQRALNGFLRRAQADGAKVAIVVTGKGLSREEGGVLRRVVPMWLQALNLRDVVVGFGEAARHHGGEGALYVQIRRSDRHRA
ncbi:Smr/MutS family protein [Methylocystis parvus]|uniref:Smr/MutS family protein n=1 Tax=Methylocystis parvus TaxID=134 RepID=UPI003C769ABF